MEFLFSDGNKRYHTLAYYNAHHGGKAAKACLDGGFTCPNADGTKGVGGCVFCKGGAGYFTFGGGAIAEQIDSEVRRIRAKSPSARIVGYLQSNSCTYGNMSRLREIYTSVLSHPDIDRLTVATRADCVSPEVADLLCELGASVELGLQTIFDSTAQRINRCHTFEEFCNGYTLLKSRGIRVCVHLIDSLPGENTAMMVESARVLGQMHPDGVKIHMLHVIKGTAAEDMWQRGEIFLMSREEYADTVVSQLEVMPPETVVERLTGDADKSVLLAPAWSADKIKTLALIDRRFAERDTWQGRLFR